MKKIILLLMFSTVIFSCKNSEEKKDDTQAPKTDVSSTEKARPNLEKVYRGEFIYTKDGAVLKGKDFIYGVKVNNLAKELAKEVAEVPKDKYDMVPVIVEGDLAKKPENTEGWDEILTITKILSVSKIVVKPDVKLREPAKKI